MNHIFNEGEVPTLLAIAKYNGRQILGNPSYEGRDDGGILLLVANASAKWEQINPAPPVIATVLPFIDRLLCYGLGEFLYVASTIWLNYTLDLGATQIQVLSIESQY